MNLIDIDQLDCIVIENCSNEFAEGVKYILEEIDKLPHLDYIPIKHGYWIPRNENKKYSRGYYCSKCGRCVEIISEENVSEEYPYCHCGAKMEEGIKYEIN